MKADEYDDYLLDPTGYFLSKYLPRVGEAFEGLAELPMIPALYYIRLMVGLRPFSNPNVVKSLERIQKTAEESNRLMAHSINFAKEMHALGFPISYGVGSIAPFDFFGDYLRGSKGVMLDMFRRKDKLLAAMERASHFILKQAILGGQASPSKFVFIPLHWGLDGFMSPDQFKTFYWPQLRKIVIGLIDAGLIPTLLWEGNCASRLETIADIPRGKAVYWFERTDLAKAKEVLGDVVCLRGNVPTSMMVTGTPDEVDAYCRRLIVKVGKGGGLILDAGCGIPDESRIENVRAMFQSVKKYSA
jgi:uroporphyrinogen-III decarboxylase